MFSFSINLYFGSTLNTMNYKPAHVVSDLKSIRALMCLHLSKTTLFRSELRSSQLIHCICFLQCIRTHMGNIGLCPGAALAGEGPRRRKNRKKEMAPQKYDTKLDPFYYPISWIIICFNQCFIQSMCFTPTLELGCSGSLFTVVEALGLMLYPMVEIWTLDVSN